MNSPWKLLTVKGGSTPAGELLLVNTSLYETVRPDGNGSRLYPRVASPNVYLAVTEPFELVCAMLTEQPDEPARE